MALLRGLEPVATIASVARADAGGLISLILKAALTVRRNKDECRELARRTMMTGDLIRKLECWEITQYPEVRAALDGLGDTLREACALVESCQDSSAMQRFFMGWKQADQFRQVNKKINSYLQLFPFVCHIDITGRLERLSGAATCQTQSSQAAKSVSESFTEHSYFDARSEGRANGSESTISMKTQQATDLSEAKEQQREVTNPQPSAHPTGFAVFDFSQLSAVNFSNENVIGRGGFGTVYKIITARRCYPFVDAEHPCDHLVAYAWDLWTTGRTIDLIDPALIYEPRLAEILRCIDIALLCVQVDPLDRPSMPDVVHMLSCGSMVLPRPWHAADEDRQERSGGRTVDAERQAVAACLHAKQKLARRPRVAFQLQ